MVAPTLNSLDPTRFIPLAGELATVAPVIAQVSFVTPHTSEVIGSGVAIVLLQSVPAATSEIFAGQDENTGAVLSPTTTCTVVVELHPLAVAVIVKVVVCIVAGNELVNVPEIALPLPLAAIPVNIPTLSRVHEKVVPATVLGLNMSICAIVPPEHIC